MGLVNLAGLSLDGFELPGKIEFGGKQRAVVHKLIGGARVIDAMGRDDAVLKWHGVLSGADAANRARTLDAIRAGGAIQSLSWDAFCYTVLISELRLTFCSPWWIPYEISCTVQQDLSYSFALVSPTTLSSIVDDLTSASQLLGPSDTLNTQSISALLSSGSAGQREASTSIATFQTTLSRGVAGAEVGIGYGNLALLVSSAGSLAQFCCAQGYLGRSALNISEIGT